MIVLVVAVLLAIVPVVGARQARAASTTSGWLAAQVAPDGSVLDPYSATASVDWAVNVATALLLAEDQPDALDRLMRHIEQEADAYLADATSDVTGHLSWLILLAVGTGRDPHGFGASSLDLVARLQARLGITEPGLFGTVDDYTPVTNQSLAIMALTAAGAEVPAAAVDWLIAQQCGAPFDAPGSWQGHRAVIGAGLADCHPGRATTYYDRPETGSTSFALMALAAVREVRLARSESTAAIDDAILAGRVSLLFFLDRDGPEAGGFGQYLDDPADPNSTGVVLMALHAIGIDPTSAEWLGDGGATAVDSLRSWVITSGPAAGASASPYSGGEADLFATFQALWGATGRSYPFVFEPELGPPDPLPSSPDAVVLTPSFTG